MRLHDALDVLLDGVVRARGRVWAISQPSPRHVAGVGRRRVERRRGRSRPGRPPRPRGRSSGKGRCTR
ncbi:hypothetical protein [Saccharothrix sp. ALI-22-I]|uniref:hypothetical protein n=1 Tax=Saccharothrix sp. ALI-22-I TaxID=1933778 RepID=UPI001EE71E38|nr:hypothetical protein [Saccharothrix sp. ALI-22-I]